MNGRRKAARVLVAFGSVVLLASAALHSMLAYPSVSAALAASNLMVSASRENPIESGRLACLFDSRQERPHSISRGNVSLQLR